MWSLSKTRQGAKVHTSNPLAKPFVTSAPRSQPPLRCRRTKSDLGSLRFVITLHRIRAMSPGRLGSRMMLRWCRRIWRAWWRLGVVTGQRRRRPRWLRRFRWIGRIMRLRWWCSLRILHRMDWERKGMGLMSLLIVSRAVWLKREKEKNSFIPSVFLFI